MVWPLFLLFTLQFFKKGTVGHQTEIAICSIKSPGKRSSPAKQRQLNPDSEKVEGAMKKGTKNTGILRYMNVTLDT